MHQITELEFSILARSKDKNARTDAKTDEHPESEKEGDYDDIDSLRVLVRVLRNETVENEEGKDC